MIKSLIKDAGAIWFPTFQPGFLYMRPINLSNPELPEYFTRYAILVRNMLERSPVQHGTAFLTIDSKLVPKGQTHRRPGLHVDGNYSQGCGWDRPRPGFNNWTGYTGGMLIATSYAACEAYTGEFQGEPAQYGDCEHFRSQLETAEKIVLQANSMYVTNSTCVHESVPVRENVARIIVRITLPADAKVF